MGIFKRITATVAANVDSGIATMANHNAVVEASLHELRTAGAKFKARLRRVQADSDATKALEYLRRKRAAIIEQTSTEQTLAATRTLIARLAASIEKIDARQREIEQTRTLMQSRERAAVATRTLDEAQRFAGTIDIDDILERWEARIADFFLTKAPIRTRCASNKR
ncbi:MAG: PspA/IM30 family protein [Gammaproteobacteria bacterium]|jgi:phage shock protein A